VAADRNKREEYAPIRVRLLKRDITLLRRKLAEERMSANAFFEAVVRAYLRADPAIVGVLEDWRREEIRPETSRRGSLPREIDDIYDAIEGDMMADEEE